MDLQDVKDIAEFVLLGGLFLALLFIIVGTPVVLIDKAGCNRIASDSNINTEYRLIGGCYVEVNGRMIPKDNWRGEYEQ